MEFNLSPLILTFKLAIITTFFLLLIGLPLAYWLTYWKNKSKYLLQTLVSMPLVLPPTVIGFYLLIAFNPENFFGRFLLSVFDIQLVFSFEGLVVASMIYSLPFMVNPIQAGLQSLPASIMEASYTLGKSKLKTFTHVLIPNIKPSLITGIIISFAHTVGEFGVILMIGGSIPGKTRVASIAIYDEVEALNYDNAHYYSLILFAITFVILLAVYIFNRRYLKAF
ncbi:molybdate ABC transporter permease subunit [candidate division KSB1 bacterium]|nr:molybdate ABC transporter permease subunit [candidate division KSB1 bacterium]